MYKTNVFLATVVVGCCLLFLANLGVSSQSTGETDMPDPAKKLSEAVAQAAAGNWGLSFQQEGQTPVGSATAEELARYNAYYAAPASDDEKAIYLTFDAGYENGVTEQILDILKEEAVPAAFFLVGDYLEAEPELVKRMAAEGHLVGNHTMSHPDMSAIADEEAFRRELTELEALYEQVTGRKMKKYYRPPQGKYSQANLQQAADLGYVTCFWSLAYVDWLETQQPTREEALTLLNRRIHPGAIVLLHSTSHTNGQILQELIQGWKDRGYTFRSLEELGVKKV